VSFVNIKAFTQHLRPDMENNRQTFWRGFVRGMAAPAMLFSSPPTPEIRQPAMRPLYRPAKNDGEALRQDVLRVGDDMRRAIQTYAAE